MYLERVVDRRPTLRAFSASLPATAAYPTSQTQAQSKGPADLMFTEPSATRSAFQQANPERHAYLQADVLGEGSRTQAHAACSLCHVGRQPNLGRSSQRLSLGGWGGGISEY
jgi:hypothetical protein